MPYLASVACHMPASPYMQQTINLYHTHVFSTMENIERQQQSIDVRAKNLLFTQTGTTNILKPVDFKLKAEYCCDYIFAI